MSRHMRELMFNKEIAKSGGSIVYFKITTEYNCQLISDGLEINKCQRMFQYFTATVICKWLLQHNFFNIDDRSGATDS